MRKDESLEAALRRAIKESTGLEVCIPAAPFYVQAGKGKQSVRRYYRCQYTGNRINCKARWVELKELNIRDKKLSEYLRSF